MPTRQEKRPNDYVRRGETLARHDRIYKAFSKGRGAKKAYVSSAAEDFKKQNFRSQVKYDS